ncbi:hypothetical protein N3K66_003112 [Trichothecium roseum]|uniref:Uncharacterized protein n=1 Tax=Trichothecium roseum TaxID=47278 RepID=A0ACC0V5V0_9HYPO|nr:hypothetical protein N3K66_003112 [Trichothecium roseum]
MELWRSPHDGLMNHVESEHLADDRGRARTARAPAIKDIQHCDDDATLSSDPEFTPSLDSPSSDGSQGSSPMSDQGCLLEFPRHPRLAPKRPMPVIMDNVDTIDVTNSESSWPASPLNSPSISHQQHDDDIGELPVSHEAANCDPLDCDPIDCDPVNHDPNVRVELPESTLLTPRSFYEPFDPGLPVMSEKAALKYLDSLGHTQSATRGDIEIELNDFAVYIPLRYCGTEMRPLHHLHARRGANDYLWDGALAVNGVSRVFVRGALISAMPIGNYGSFEHHIVSSNIWFASSLDRHGDIFYKLGRPAKEYKRFFDPFLWIADLAKHFVDFLAFWEENKVRVTIRHFESEFSAWTMKVHGHSAVYWQWAQQHPSNDYRTSITANASFLRKECFGVLGEKDTNFHLLWAEILDFERYRPIPSVDTLSTVVTQYIYDCFEHLPFGDCLRVGDVCEETKDLRRQVLTKAHLEMPAPIHLSHDKVSVASASQIRAIEPGDTISTPRDDVESGTDWKREMAHGFTDVDRWFALVLKVHTDSSGRRSFDVIWYYRPVDTLCGQMKYPWQNELFLSNHCSCHEKSKIRESEVLGVHDIEFHGSSTTKAEFFCRSTYLSEDRKWVTLEDAHLRCEHVADTTERLLLTSESEFEIGDTVLIRLEKKSGISQPCEIVNQNIHGPGTYWVRVLLRRADVEAQGAKARPNELLYSSRFVNCTIKSIMGRCHIRHFGPHEAIPAPYDRGGVGGFFYITGVGPATAADDMSRVEFPPRNMKQGFDPRESMPKLRGLDLFCGGGNFGRGLEDGGAVRMRWANDYDVKAMHTYMANARDADIDPFLGSIDDLQRAAMQGRFSESVPRIGEVDFVSGGSPCPGFSTLTNDKTTPGQRKNQSLVASFASFVDLYRPRYGVLENVAGIVQARRNRDQDVFSQLVCAIVGLGYQTQLFLLDASACGSPQRRTRVFVVFAAPRCVMPRAPIQTHAHPAGTRPLKLGRLPTGEPMAERDMPSATPFPFVSAEAATADLPPIHDAKPDACVPFPDHRIGNPGHTKQLRDKIYLIPVWPLGSNFSQAWFGGASGEPGSGVLTAAERAAFPPEKRYGGTGRSTRSSNAYGRQDPRRLIETVTTYMSPSDFKAGRTLHWREARCLSVMEARRAQGFRDDVILGTSCAQLRVVGNSVAREVALAVGLAFREAWSETLARGGGGGSGGGVSDEEGGGRDRGDDDDDSDEPVRVRKRRTAMVVKEEEEDDDDQSIVVRRTRIKIEDRARKRRRCDRGGTKRP